jgi:hypothetical protein
MEIIVTCYIIDCINFGVGVGESELVGSVGWLVEEWRAWGVSARSETFEEYPNSFGERFFPRFSRFPRGYYIINYTAIDTISALELVEVYIQQVLIKHVHAR